MNNSISLPNTNFAAYFARAKLQLSPVTNGVARFLLTPITDL